MIEYHSTVVEIAREPLLAAAGLAASGIFDTYVVYEGKEAEWSVAGGVAAEVILEPDRVRCSYRGERTERSWQGDPLLPAREFLAGLPISDWRAYGWSAFELAYAVAGMPTEEEVLLHLVVPETEIRLCGSRAEVRSLDPDVLAVVAKTMAEPPPATLVRTPDISPDLETGADAYRAEVADGSADIRAGKLQKMILSRAVPLNESVDFPASFVNGRRANTPARSFLLRMGGLSALGFSPESVVEVDAEGRAASQPLAGTRALTADPARNRALREELLSDPKELHEHAVSVKQAVDELADSCKPETVVVKRYMDVQERGSVQHIASTVAGDLREGATAWDAFTAVFPAVTASGVPKTEAYEAIRRYEPRSRGPYAGAVMTVSADGSMDAALVLRSVFSRSGETWLQAGAGIMDASRPERELEETREKLGSIAGCLVARPEGR